MMWKHAIFLGGAVFILAACSDATAPTPPAQATVRATHGTASVKQGGTTTTSPTLQPEDCRSGYSVSVGFSVDTTTVGGCVLR